MAVEYTVKQGDTLNTIAQRYGFSDYKTAGITGFGASADTIQPGQKITIGNSDGSTKQEVPGLGTLTVTPKAIPTVTPQSSGGVGDNASGLYARTGIQPAPTLAGTPSGYAAPAVAGLPVYPGVDAKGSVDSIMTSYKSTLDAITALETKISGSAMPTSEEKQLQQELAAKKAQLASFDLGTLQASESLTGQGRGATIANVALQDQKMNRVRALERLGLAQEADTLITQLGLAQDARKAQGEFATTQYNLATKKLDIALGIQSKIDTINEKERDNARQYLLDVVNFSEGKTYSQLDKDTQAAITNAVANSPITLDMVKTALQKGADSAKAKNAGELRSVSGLGVVQLVPDGKGGYSYKVIVPESGNAPTGDPNAPTFEEYVAAQNIPFPALTESTIGTLRSEYDTKYGSSAGGVSLGKLTATNKRDISQAGLSNAPSPVQSYFLNTPSAFRDQWQRDYASGNIKDTSLNAMIKKYTDWYNAQNSGNRDWGALLGG